MMKKLRLFLMTLVFVLIFGTITAYAEGTVEKAADGRYRYKNEDGSYAVNQWTQRKDKRYFAGPDGYLVTGWKQEGSDWYYFDSTASLHTGKRIVDYCHYYFDDETGKMLHDTSRTSGRDNQITTYYGSDGIAIHSVNGETGETKIEDARRKGYYASIKDVDWLPDVIMNPDPVEWVNSVRVYNHVPALQHDKNLDRLAKIVYDTYTIQELSLDKVAALATENGYTFSHIGFVGCDFSPKHGFAFYHEREGLKDMLLTTLTTHAGAYLGDNYNGSIDRNCIYITMSY